MPDLTGGYRGKGTGTTRVLDAILAQPAVTWKGPPFTLAKELFARNFMPYAKANWAYHASQSNCEDLARAFHATWDYVAHKRQGLGPREVLDKASVEKVFGMTQNVGMITKPWNVFAGPARGNVRNPTTGILDGRCLFPVHYLLKVGSGYFDPTFDRTTQFRDDCVERKLKKLGLTLWLAEDERYLYERDERQAPNFADSWNEFSSKDWVTHAVWMDLSARSGHWRSSDLKSVDGALAAYEGANSPDKLLTLKNAFEKWYTRNPKEVKSRNKSSCINRLALNLGLAKTLLKTG